MDLFDGAIKPEAIGPDYANEQALALELGLPRGLPVICGVDEVGRGPLAGPVVAAAVILNPAQIPSGLNDSKKLTAKRRESLYIEIQASAVAYSIAEASVAEIDEINILQASMLAMRRAVAGLGVRPKGALVDGNRDPIFPDLPTKTLIKGDARSVSIAAASIIAKVFRDRLMAKLGEAHPAYGWGQNAGYGVAKHREALRVVGVSEHHRRSFAPIRQVLDEE
jgi:ribonuclease HII